MCLRFLARKCNPRTHSLCKGMTGQRRVTETNIFSHSDISCMSLYCVNYCCYKCEDNIQIVIMKR
jgi:hypothetical protein